MDENIINSLFGCFHRLRRNNSLVFLGLLVKKTRSLRSLVFLRANLRTLVNYFSVIDKKNPNNVQVR